MSQPSEIGPKTQVYLDYLRREGYSPELDPDGDIKFKREGGTYYLMTEENDPTYFRLVFPNFWEIESDDERSQILYAVGEVNADLKVIKLYPVRDNVWASVEMFLDPIENFQKVFNRAMNVLGEGVAQFRQFMTRSMN
jgi:hypothetical protein